MAEIAEKHPFLTHGGFRKSPDTVLGALSLNKKSQISKDSGILGMNGFSRGQGSSAGERIKLLSRGLLCHRGLILQASLDI